VSSSTSINGQRTTRLKVLAFDVYGTVVDWRSTIIREGSALHPALDWSAIADTWRSLYRPTIERVTRGELAWSPFDALQRLMLDEVLARLGGDRVSDSERTYLAELWSHMDAWPDVVSGLNRLKRDFIITPLSNGSVMQLTSIAKHAGLPWDLILSVELFRAYKPDPRIYTGAIELLQRRPHEVMMVATHAYDLRAARDIGLHTAFVTRPLEWGSPRNTDRVASGEFDLIARDFEDLADQLCASD
jgi:2-haloacid dehalogenase